MKLTQEFSPITIMLETQEEANILWDFVEAYYKRYKCGSVERDFLINLSNSFSSRESGKE